MYSLKAMLKAPRGVPVLLTFRKRVQKGKLAGSHEFRIACILRCDPEPYWPWLSLMQILACDVLASQEMLDWFFSGGWGHKGNARFNPLYLQTIEPIPEKDLPLLLGWPRQYPLLAQYLGQA